METVIRPFSYTCARDWKSFELVVRSWSRFRSERWTVFFDPDQPYTDEMKAFVEKYQVTFKRQSRPNFGQWCWDSSMCKLDGWREMVAPETDDNVIILYCDSDSIFLNDIGPFIQGEFCGFPHSIEIPVNGEMWAHFSGCLQTATVRAARKIAALNEEQLKAYRKAMVDNGNICQNEDVVISFLMLMCGVERAPFSPSTAEHDPEAVLLGKKRNWRPYSHLCGIMDRSFCGVHVNAKWDIPDAIKAAGIVI